MALPYNPSDPEDILRYAKGLIGMQFKKVLDDDNSSMNTGYQQSDLTHYISQAPSYGDKNRKGGLGNLIEKHYFHYEPNSNPDPDFPDAGLELKVSPYERILNKKNECHYRAGERLVLTMINYNEAPIEFNLLASHLWHKCGKILLIYYLRDKSLESNLDYRIDYVDIFTPSSNDMAIIRNDYKIIMDKIAAGMAHEISEGDTMYLGACTKGATSATSRIIQERSGIVAQKRAFCFKVSYMTTILNERFVSSSQKQDSILTENDYSKTINFEDILEKRISKYIGLSDRIICQQFGIVYSGNKAQWTMLSFRMLGVSSNRAEELQKANIVIKTVRVEEKGNIIESMSFPAFKFLDLVEEEWIDVDSPEDELGNTISIPGFPSKLQSYFASTKFLFIVFKKVSGEYRLMGCLLWNMPLTDLNNIVRPGWEKIRDILREGVKLNITHNKGNIIVKNNFPQKTDNAIIHIRPHSSKAYYKFDGFEKGNHNDGNKLPGKEDRWMTTQCFWLNNTYIESILKKQLK